MVKTTINRLPYKDSWSGWQVDGPIKATVSIDHGYDHRGSYGRVDLWTQYGWQTAFHYAVDATSESFKTAIYNPVVLADASEDEIKQAIADDLEELMQQGRDFLAGL